MSKDEADSQEISELTKGSRMVPMTNPLNLFAIDLRSLALFRITLSLVLVMDLFYRMRDLSFFYTDAGALPRIDAIRVASSANISFHYLNGTFTAQAILFIVEILIHLCLLFGYRTKTASILSFVFVLSLQRRNYQILQGGDDLIRLLTLWAMFLPISARWSIDATKAPADGRTSTRSIASAALLIQTVMMYVFSAILKSGAEWRTEGTAVALALKLDQFTKPFGYFLLEFPGLLHFMSLSVWRLEMYGPFLAFIPICNPYFRALTVLMFWGFHFGLFLSMELGPFPFICMVAWTPFIPAEFWDRFFPISKINPDIPPLRLPWTRKRISLFAAKYLTVTAFLIIAFAWNVRGIDFMRWQKYFPAKYNFLAQSIGLEQYWSMFAPYPLLIDGWYVIVGTTISNRTINLGPSSHPDDPIIDEKPQRVSDTYPTERWRKYMMNLTNVDNQWWRPLFLIALSRRWNKENPKDPIKAVDLFYWTERTRLDGPEARQKELLWHYESGLK